MKNVGLVTGATGYLGQEILKKLLINGYSIIGTYSQKNLNLDLVKVKFKKFILNGQLELEHLDVVNEKEIQSIANKYKIDFLINNAGISKSNLAISTPLKDWENIINVNLTGTFLVTKEIVKSMLINHCNGSIVNISSIVGINGNKGQIAYASSKAGIIGMMHVFAKEYSKKGIRFNTIAPGYLKLGIAKSMNNNEVTEKIKANDLNRLGTAYEISNIVYFLVSDKSSYINDSTIVADGGEK